MSDNWSMSDIDIVSAVIYNKKIKELPIWEKSLLTVVEAAKYFQIGENNIRKLVRNYTAESFVVWKDGRVYVRREPFETFLNQVNEV